MGSRRGLRLLWGGAAMGVSRPRGVGALRRCRGNGSRLLGGFCGIGPLRHVVWCRCRAPRSRPARCSPGVDPPCVSSLSHVEARRKSQSPPNYPSNPLRPAGLSHSVQASRRVRPWRRGRHAAGCSPSNRMRSVANRHSFYTTPDGHRQPEVYPDGERRRSPTTIHRDRV